VRHLAKTTETGTDAYETTFHSDQRGTLFDTDRISRAREYLADSVAKSGLGCAGNPCEFRSRDLEPLGFANAFLAASG